MAVDRTGTAQARAVAAAAGERAVVPRLAIVLGSGLGDVADVVDAAAEISYAEIDGLPGSSVAGHAGRLVLGRIGDLPVVVLDGRAHLYEGVPAAELALPMRVVRALGAEEVLFTNAAGSLHDRMPPGRLMAIADHLNLTGANPLTGANDDAVGPRFVPMGDAYDGDLRRQLQAAALAEAIALAEGVYVGVAGPSYETAAEIRAFRQLGGDAVGMSTVLEVIAARHCGLRVAAVSVITNLAEGLSRQPPSHEETLAVASEAAGDLRRLVVRFAAGLSRR